MDVGAGSGIIAKALSDSVSFYLALDLVWDNVKKLNFTKSVRAVMGDACALPLKENQVDLILAMAMIYYINFDNFLIESRRVLKDGGRLIFCTSNPEVPSFCKARNTTKYYNLFELNDKLLKYGYEPVFYGAFSVNPINPLNNIFLVKLKNMFKKIFKSKYLIYCWVHARNLYYGGVLPFSEKDIFDEIQSSRLPRALRLDSLDYNKEHRVIYCIASLRK